MPHDKANPTRIRRVLLVSTDAIAPNPTGSGNRAIRWGLLEGLAQGQFEVGFYVAEAPGRHKADFEFARDHFTRLGGRFWLDQPGPLVSAASVMAFTDALDSFQPDLVLTYGLEPLRLVRATRFEGVVGLMSIDLEHRGGLHRHLYNLRFGRPKQQLKSLLQTPIVLTTAAWYLHEVRRDYPKADFLVNHAANHAEWHRARHGRPVLYVPNPLSALVDEPPTSLSSQPPRFALIGGIGGIATLTGLAWFAKKVYPTVEPAIRAREIEIHLIGRGAMEPSIERSMPLVVKRGYVEDLTAEMRLETAVLVPTPIELGFRTRILDAFRHGVAVVAHKANTMGMPELEHERNALVAADPAAFARAILHLAHKPDEAARLGRAAFLQFQRELNATVVARRIVRFAELEVSGQAR